MMTEERRLLRAAMGTRRKVDDLVLPELGTDAIGPHLALPALRAFWPMSSVDYAGASRCRDVSGNGYYLADAGGGANVLFSYDTANPLVPIAIFGGGANDYLFGADGGVSNWADIGTGAGSDLAIRAAERGLTLHGWFWWSALPGAGQFLMGKDDGGANRQYQLVIQAANVVSFYVWPGPIGVNSGATIVAGWNHITSIYDQPTQTLYIELNGMVSAGGMGAAPAALADTSAPFTIAANGAGANRFTGYGSMCTLQACSMHESGNFTTILGLREQTRSIFGV